MPENDSSTTEKVLHVVQAMALLGAGAWAFFKYLAHDRETARLALQQQTLANAQAELTLKLSESQAKMRKAELETSVELQKQELELKRLQSAKAAHELTQSTKYRFEPSVGMTRRRVRRVTSSKNEYEVVFSFGIANKAEVPFQVTALVVDYYIGIPKRSAGQQQFSVRPMGMPTDRWNPSGAVDGALEWQQVGHTGSVDGELPEDMIKIAADRLKQLNLIRGGPATGKLAVGQTFVYEDTYFVTAPEHAHLAFVMSYCFNRCTSPDDFFSFIRVESLEETSKPPLRVGV